MKTPTQLQNEAAIAHLKQLARKHTATTHPNMPLNYIVVRDYDYKTANGLTCCLVDYIELIGGYATRINTAGIYDKKLGTHRPGTTALGTADIHAIVKGKHLSIEVKIGTDRLSEYQKRTKQKVIQAGGYYIVARDFKSVYDFIGRLQNV